MRRADIAESGAPGCSVSPRPAMMPDPKVRLSASLVYVACRRTGMLDGFPHPHHGQWGRTLPLAMCWAVVRAYADLVEG